MFFMLIFAVVQNALSNTSDLIQSSNSALISTAARFELHDYHIAWNGQYTRCHDLASIMLA